MAGYLLGGWYFNGRLCVLVQAEHDGSDVQVRLNVDHHEDQDILPNMKRSPRVKYITYYEDAESLPGSRTAVWELDKGILLYYLFPFLPLGRNGLALQYCG